MAATSHPGIRFYDITTLPKVGDAMTKVTLDVSDEDGDGKLEVGDKIGGNAITKITPVQRFKVNPTGGGEQVDYGGNEEDEFGLEIEVNDNGTTKTYFIPSGMMNEELVAGTFVSKSTGTNVIPGNKIPTTSEKGVKFHTYYASNLTIANLLCFFPGTLISTPAGERRIEELVPGDSVLTADGRAVATKWISRQTVSTRFGPAERLMPVRFAAGSLGGGLPHSDLTVTADHAVLLDGVLCEAGALVNETTITWVSLSELGEGYTVYHLEADAHEVVLANGAPAETFVDNASRSAFDNYAEHEALYGANPPEMEELPYPRAANARHLPSRIRDSLGMDGSASDKVA